MTFALDMKIMTESIPDLVMNSGEVDGVVMNGAMSTGFMTAVYPHLSDLMPGVTCEDMLKGMIRDVTGSVQIPFKNNMPMTVSAFFDRCDQYTAEYEDNFVPVFDSPEKAARAMAAMVTYQRVQNRASYEPSVDLKPTETAFLILKEAREKGQKALDEFSAKQLLGSYGIPVSRERLVHSPAEALDAAIAIGFPVVVKACDPEILHKTEQGLVYLNVGNSEEVKRAYDAIQQSVQMSGRQPVAVLVGEMAAGSREFLAGITWDDQFGHCLAFGVGGIFTEAINDIRYRVAPVSESEAGAMIREIKHPKLLSAFRGMPEVNMGSLSKILSTLSLMPLLHPEIREIDMNPLIISGAEPVVVDALIVIGTQCH